MSVIVSLTSHQKRLATLHLCLDSLFLQQYQPDRVVLYLHEGEKIAENIKSFQDKGLEVKYFTDDYKPHNKYFHAMREYPDDIIITFDDDAIYPPYLLKLLVETHQQFPEAVITGRAHKIRMNQDGSLLPYQQWDWETSVTGTPSIQIMATGVGGVLYPPHCMHPELFNAENILRLCLYSDDIWLKCMQVLNNTPVIVVAHKPQHPKSIKEVAKEGLFLVNKLQNRNDFYLSSVTKQYNINWKEMIENDEKYNT